MQPGGQKTDFLIPAVKHSQSLDIHSQAAMLDSWHQEYSQLSPGEFSGSIHSIETSGFRLFCESMNRAVFQKGFVKSGNIGFGFIVNAGGQAVICGEDVSEQSLLVFSGGNGFEFLSPQNFKFIGVEINISGFESETVFEKKMILKLGMALNNSKRALILSKDNTPDIGQNLLQILKYLESRKNTRIEPKLIRLLRQQIIGNILDFLPEYSAPDSSLAGGVSRYWPIVCNIRDIIFQSPECPFSMTEIALHLNLSSRTIQTACNNALGLSPLVFVRALRLSEVRREIMFCSSVSDAATRWGFWHFGYFSRDYKRMFGELPSDTFRQSKI